MRYMTYIKLKKSHPPTQFMHLEHWQLTKPYYLK